MRDDAGTGFELAQELRAHCEVQLWLEEQHDHCCFPNASCEEVFVQKPDSIGCTCLARVLSAFGNASGIDVDADAARVELARRSDDNAPVAAPQVVHDIAGLYLGQPQHGLDHVHRGGLVTHVGRAQYRRCGGRLLREAGAGDASRGDDGAKDCSMSSG